MSGKVLDTRARQVIISVDEYFTKEKEETKQLLQALTHALKHASDTNQVVISKIALAEMIVILQDKARVTERVASATGVARKTVARLRVEKEKARLSGREIEAPIKKKRAKKVFLDEFALSVLKNVIESYVDQNEVPTMHELLAFAQQELNYQGGLTKLRYIIKNDLGYIIKTNVKKN